MQSSDQNDGSTAADRQSFLGLAPFERDGFKSKRDHALGYRFGIQKTASY